ncbi:restriction endonuclease subunit S [Streptomyces sp. col6]|uniref:restriction endonuclease subunit S n=1 Tax=Streptomyces sp. col6 TaxID=2478958 RepID=UPI0017468AD4|nr:restriction endonuclease subunit S [Streptomyces sp. col6]
MAEWPTVRFEEIAAPEKSAFSKPYGSAYTRNDYVPSGIPLVRGVNLGAGPFHDDDFVFISSEKADTLPGANLKPGDLVITHRGTIGQVSMIPRNPRHDRYVLSTSQVKARLDRDKAVPEFYYYWLLSPVGQKEILQHVSTVGVPGLVQPVATVKSFKVPVPSLDEQRTVVAVLGALDDKIAVNERIANTADQLADAVFGRTVRSLGSRPMVEIVEPVLGGTPDRKVEEFWGGDLPWASVKDVANSVAGALVVTEECITTLGEQSSRAKRMPAGAVILTARGTVGLVARLAISAAFNQSCYAFVPSEIPPAVLFHLIRLASTRMMGLAHGTVFSTVNMKTFQHVEVPDIPRELLHSLEAELGPLHGLIEANLKESLTLSTLRDTLLSQLMSGRIRVKDAEKIVEDHL